MGYRQQRHPDDGAPEGRPRQVRVRGIGKSIQVTTLQDTIRIVLLDEHRLICTMIFGSK